MLLKKLNYNFMDKIVIDNSFISKWHPRYEETEVDQRAYEQIILAVADDIKKLGTLSNDVFKRILVWKSPRLMGIVKLEKFNSYYSPAIKNVLIVSDDQKLKILDDLYGIGAPTASTILHFIYPDKFPIIDVRTIRALFTNGYIEHKSTGARNYSEFRNAILSIKKVASNYSLREIDRAPFCF